MRIFGMTKSCKLRSDYHSRLNFFPCLFWVVYTYRVHFSRIFSIYWSFRRRRHCSFMVASYAEENAGDLQAKQWDNEERRQLPNGIYEFEFTYGWCAPFCLHVHAVMWRFFCFALLPRHSMWFAIFFIWHLRHVFLFTFNRNDYNNECFQYRFVCAPFCVEGRVCANRHQQPGRCETEWSAEIDGRIQLTIPTIGAGGGRWRWVTSI